ncbi:hypothetical protein DSM112329_04929 [Paraconexibacter sp. AEG42_29]|uniref:AbiEi antitoxin N-terminal domain-containing protein n=1 Tax=Paraconexibacter sp. AEG42_29 TaxID=2997339 RepID=A0AAU7B283_9ACTN
MAEARFPEGFDKKAHRRAAGGHMDATLTALADLQHGHVTTKQLRALGWSRDQLRERVRSGHLTRRHVGVLLVGSSVPTSAGRRMGAVLAAGADVVLGQLSAAAQLGAKVREPHSVHVIIPPSRRVERVGVSAYRSAVLPHERTVADGVPCPTWPRLLLQLAACRSTQLEHLWHDAIYRRQLDDAALAKVLIDHEGAPGTAELRRLWEQRLYAIGRSANKLEADLRDIVVEAGLPEPHRNWRVDVDGQTLRPDLYIPEYALAVEGDGRDGHSDPEQQLNDARRDAAYRKLGLHPVRIGWWAVGYQRPGVVADFARYAGAWRRTGGRWTTADPLPVFEYARRS